MASFGEFHSNIVYLTKHWLLKYPIYIYIYIYSSQVNRLERDSDRERYSHDTFVKVFENKSKP